MGYPAAGAVYQIIRSCLQEMQKRGIILENEDVDLPDFAGTTITLYSQPEAACSKLHKLAMLANGISGRALRRLCVVAHARYIQKEHCTMAEMIEALYSTVQYPIANK